MSLKTIPISILIYAVFLLSGCSKTTVIIEGSGNNPSSGSDGRSTLVTFNASVENRILTRAMSAMNTGIFSQLYAFDSTRTIGPGFIPNATGIYVTSSPGVLAGYQGYKMYIPYGKYNFYGVSDNMSVFPPKFLSRQSEPLFNGIDYLWWSISQQDVTSSQINIPIVYTHAATQVVFEVQEGDGVTLSQLVSANITPPAPGTTMDLFTGVITPVTTYDISIDKMGINGFRAQHIMLPFQNTQPMTLTVEVVLAGQTNSKTYTVDVPLPGGELKAGDSYLFSVIVHPSSIEFSEVNIKDWTEVDETGKPLYPK